VPFADPSVSRGVARLQNPALAGSVKKLHIDTPWAGSKNSIAFRRPAATVLPIATKARRFA
jgi:hypothetical protein